MPLPAFVGPLVAGLGSLMGMAGAADANRTSERMARDQMRLQREFAQKGIQWRVEDAKAAGLHPLAALGANPANYSPVGLQQQNPMADMGQGAAGQIAHNREQARLRREHEQNLTIERRRADSESFANWAIGQEALASARAASAVATGTPPNVTDLQDSMQALSANDNPGTAAVETVSQNDVKVRLFGIPLTIPKGLITPGSIWQELFGEPGEWVAGAANIATVTGYMVNEALEDLSRNGLLTQQKRREFQAAMADRGFSPGGYLRQKED